MTPGGPREAARETGPLARGNWAGHKTAQEPQHGPKGPLKDPQEAPETPRNTMVPHSEWRRS
eukprot:7982431-Pyramimonas_sp.AAC.1